MVELPNQSQQNKVAELMGHPVEYSITYTFQTLEMGVNSICIEVVTLHIKYT